MATEGQGDSTPQPPSVPPVAEAPPAPQPAVAPTPWVDKVFGPGDTPLPVERRGDVDAEFDAPPRDPSDKGTAAKEPQSDAGGHAEPEHPPTQPPITQTGDPADESPPQPPELVKVETGDGREVEVSPEAAAVIESQRKRYQELQGTAQKRENELSARLAEPPKPAEPVKPATTEQAEWEAFEKSDASFNESIENEGRGFTQKFLSALEAYQGPRDERVEALEKTIADLKANQDTILRLTRDDLMTTEGTQAIQQAAGAIGIDVSKFADPAAIVLRGNEIAAKAGKVLDPASFWQAAAELGASGTPAPPAKPNGTTPPVVPPAAPPARPGVPSPGVGGLVQGGPGQPARVPVVGEVIHKSSGSGIEGL